MRSSFTGLVLSGGGAKGAYQVGIVRALAEKNVAVSAVSGASIGALNGAIVASSKNMGEAAERLKKLWYVIAEDPPLGSDEPTLLRLLEAVGLRFKPEVRNTAKLAREMAHNLLPTLISPETQALVDNSRIKTMLAEYVSFEQLQVGIPLYVSVYPNRSYVESVIGSSLAFLGIKDNPGSEFLHVQSLPPQEQQKALLASAAIPFLFGAQEVLGEKYVDGGLGGLFSSQGNTPISPLLDFGCDAVIVTSLSDHSAWNKQKHPAAAIIAVDRDVPIDRTPLLPEVFDIISFHPSKIYSWMEQGYGDAIRCLSSHPELCRCER